ncbi:MAG TPA: 23S rRNA (guanosine(2251)-2'-O)-methyltransferase RlmB [Acidimicrobiia bacterium]
MSERRDRPRGRDHREPRAREPRTRDLGQQVEGRRAVRELLVAGRRRVREVWVAGEVEEIEHLAEEAGARVRHVPPDQLAGRARTDAPQGVVAMAAPLQPADVDDLLADPGAFLVAVDGVTDPQNLGAIVRSAEASGATGIVLPKHRAVGVTPTVAKTAAGAIEYLPIAFVSGVAGALERAARTRVWSIGLDAGGDTSIFDVPVADQPLVLVLGAEGPGLSRLARARCDVLASIPMRGNLESLNVSAAAAIACTEIGRRRENPRP